jgi:protein-S-isoprenylcysteine O-methyltransferase Ste14
MWNIALFLFFTLVWIYISRASLFNRHSHGFYRFFAWEAILALILLNIAVWFQNWLAWYQIISWLLLILCIIPLVFGIYYLRSRGLPDKNKRSEPPLLGFERTTVLVTSGIYHFIRHPLYSSLFLLTWGVFFKQPSLPGVLFAIIASFFLIQTAKADEAECILTFGRQYQDYMKKTRRFIPLIY